MLLHLRAQNLGVIGEAEIEPGPGLTVITGETGAGKTLLLGALRLLAGETSDPGLVGSYAASSQADGLFDAGTELGVTRVVPKEGRSRSYVDGKVVSASVLREKLADLIEIVGQHDQLELMKPRFVLDLVDANLDDEGKARLAAHAESWLALQRAHAERELLGGSQIELARELDLVRYQNREIAQAGFVEHDDEDLEKQSLRLRNAAEIREHLGGAMAAVAVAETATGELIGHLRKVRDLDPGTAKLADEAETLGYAVAELGRDMTANAESVVDDPRALALIESRLNLLGDLKMKYGRTLADILDFAEQNLKRETEISLLLDRSQTIDQDVHLASSRVSHAAAALTAARIEAARHIEVATVAQLEDLALESASVSFDFAKIGPGPRGADRIHMLFASHRDVEPGELTRVASGGELSRLVLAIKLAARRTSWSTLVFDEIDTGIGGATALAMARKLADLARNQQTLCVTHLPQVAAFADTHYVVNRSGSDATVVRCEGPDRLAELSRMIAGLPESERGQQAAAELLELAAR